jgi:hypothetical protein
VSTHWSGPWHGRTSRRVSCNGVEERAARLGRVVTRSPGRRSRAARRSAPTPYGYRRPSTRVLRSPGQPLEGTARAAMESHFGHDFSQVRVHPAIRPPRRRGYWTRTLHGRERHRLWPGLVRTDHGSGARVTGPRAHPRNPAGEGSYRRGPEGGRPAARRSPRYVRDRGDPSRGIGARVGRAIRALHHRLARRRPAAAGRDVHPSRPDRAPFAPVASEPHAVAAIARPRSTACLACRPRSPTPSPRGRRRSCRR